MAWRFLVLRYTRPANAVPGPAHIFISAGVQIPVGLGLITLTLFLIAINEPCSPSR